MADPGVPPYRKAIAGLASPKQVVSDRLVCYSLYPRAARSVSPRSPSPRAPMDRAAHDRVPVDTFVDSEGDTWA